MKKGGVLHPQLARVIAQLGHMDTIVIADAGLPIPEGCERIDLAYAPGRPPLLDVLEAVLMELEVERAVLTRELETGNESFHGELSRRLEAIPKVARAGIDHVGHEEFKLLTWEAKAVIRTGETTPYANVILRCGVTF